MNTVRFLRVILGSLLALLALAPAGSASAATKEVLRYSYQGQSVRLSAYNYDGCTSSGVYANAVDGRIKTEGRPDARSSAYINIWHYDYCNYTWLDAWGYADLDANALQIDNNLKSATLNTTIQVYDYWSGISLPVNINVTLAGTDDLVRSKYRNQYTSPVYKSTYRSDSTSREATVSGTIGMYLGTIDVGQSGSGHIESVKSAEMTMQQL